MASVKKYNLAGVNANVELGKQGPHIVGSASNVRFEDNAGNLSVIAIGDAVNSEQAVTKSQLDTSTIYKLKLSSTTVNYTDGNVSLGTMPANGYVHYVIVDPTSTWTDASANTNITVGDSSDTDRLFASFDPEVQSKDETDYKYSADTELFAYVAPATASAGTAKITVCYTAAGTLE
jgi:hypothetical protein